MKNLRRSAHIHGRASRAPLLFIMALCTTLLWQIPPSQAQTAVNVTNYGARGDAVQILVNTVSNSAVITCPTNAFTSADVGKVIEIFNGGASTGATNNADLVATINSISGTNAIISTVSSTNGTSLLAMYGTNNAAAFQSCVNALQGKNNVVTVPAGNYLLIAPQVLTGFSMEYSSSTYYAATVTAGGITFQGAGSNLTTLTGCGAWMLSTNGANVWPHRASMFTLTAPMTQTNLAINFFAMTLDGGTRGITTNNFSTMSPVNGSGWDMTHDAFWLGGSDSYATLNFSNCIVQNWRGEMIKGLAGGTGFASFTNCEFLNGDASALNVNVGHVTVGCFFSNLYQVEEFSQGYTPFPSIFSNNVVTNTFQCLMALNGALAGSPNPQYTIISNKFFMAVHLQIGIETCPAQNAIILGNSFIGSGVGSGGGSGGTAIVLGSGGYQGSTYNSNIVIGGNLISNNVFTGIAICGTGSNSCYNITITNNRDYDSLAGGSTFMGGGGWMTNVIFSNNVATGVGYGVYGNGLAGQYYPDNPSNLYPPWQYQDYPGPSNSITYGHGLRQCIVSSAANALWVMDDTHPHQVPPNSLMAVTNAQTLPVTVYFSALNYPNGGSATLTNGASVVCQWANGAWQAVASLPLPPTDFHVVVGSP